MNFDQLRQLVAQGESDRLEFKKSTGELQAGICHRDDSLPGGAVHLAMYDDRLEIISTGLLPPGITVAELKRDHASQLRNPRIAGPFYRRGLIEKWGSGTQEIVQTCVSQGYPEPEFFEQAGAFYVRFPAGAYAPPTQIRHDLTDRQPRLKDTNRK